MTDDVDRRRILDRADRLVRQSRTLRKMSEELLQESKDLRISTRPGPGRRRNGRKKR